MIREGIKNKCNVEGNKNSKHTRKYSAELNWRQTTPVHSVGCANYPQHERLQTIVAVDDVYLILDSDSTIWSFNIDIRFDHNKMLAAGAQLVSVGCPYNIDRDNHRDGWVKLKGSGNKKS